MSIRMRKKIVKPQPEPEQAAVQQHVEEPGQQQEQQHNVSPIKAPAVAAISKRCPTRQTA